MIKYKLFTFFYKKIGKISKTLVNANSKCYTRRVNLKLKVGIFSMSKIVVVGANHAGTACINAMLDNFGNENEIVVFDQNSNISFLGCGMALWIGEQIDGAEGLFYSDKENWKLKVLRFT